MKELNFIEVHDEDDGAPRLIAVDAITQVLVNIKNVTVICIVDDESIGVAESYEEVKRMLMS